MDKLVLIQFSIIGGLFVVFCIYMIINIVRLNGSLNSEYQHLEPKRKITKRKDTNVYDLKASRRK